MFSGGIFWRRPGSSHGQFREVGGFENGEIQKYTNISIFGLEVSGCLGEHLGMSDVDKQVSYKNVEDKVRAVLDGETDAIAAMATISCLLSNAFPHFYWTGFYRLLDGELVIGPYQGTLGCLRIALDRGVCGAAASSGETVVVVVRRRTLLRSLMVSVA